MASVALPGTVRAEATRRESLRDRIQANAVSGCRTTRRSSCSSHGAPITEPRDTPHFLDRATGVAGFFGAPGTKVLPTEVAITEVIRRFKRIVRTTAVAGSRQRSQRSQEGTGGNIGAPQGRRPRPIPR